MNTTTGSVICSIIAACANIIVLVLVIYNHRCRVAEYAGKIRRCQMVVEDYLTGNLPNPNAPKRESTTRTRDNNAIKLLADEVVELLQKDDLTRADISKATNLMMAASQVSLAQQAAERTNT